jgi:GAF domain-containing protein
MSDRSCPGGAESPADASQAFVALTGLLHGTPPLQDFLAELAVLAAKVFSPPGACGITLRNDGSPFTAASSDELADQVDGVQYDAGDGPCLDALRRGVINEIEDMATEKRWSEFCSHALAHGVRSSLSLPLRVQGEPVGALNLYAKERRAFAGEHRRQAEIFGAQGAAALSLALRQAKETAAAEQLQEALRNRAVIDQALGVIMAQERCDAEAAFAVLRRASQNRNRKLRDVAAEIVATVTGRPLSRDPEFRTG